MIQIIDVTDDERYFVQGHFPDVESANQAIDDYVVRNNSKPPSDWQSDPDQGVSLELRRLDIGWNDPVFVQRREWELTGVVDEGTGIAEWRELHSSEFD